MRGIALALSIVLALTCASAQAVDNGDAGPPGIGPTLTEIKKLVASDASAGAGFSQALTASRDTLVVGAAGDNAVTGAAYVFTRTANKPTVWGQVEKLTASDATAGDLFGAAVSVSGDTAVIGAPLDDDACPSDPNCDSGSAYVFERNHGGPDNWGEVKKLTASDAALEDTFGWLASISEDTVVVTSFRNDDGGLSSGSAYVFERNQGGPNNWGEIKKLTASDAAAEDRFGWSVAIFADTVMVGAADDDDVYTSSGSAYVFERDHGGRDNWGEVKKITASDPAALARFGHSASISGDTIVVGAMGANSGIRGSGAAYVLERDLGGKDNWGERRRMSASDAAIGDWFGAGVSVRGDFVVIGAPGNDDACPSDPYCNSGSGYLFERNTGGANNWGEVAKLAASDAVASHRLGVSVAIAGDTAVVGANGDNDHGSNSGAAYLFVPPALQFFIGDVPEEH